MQNKFSQRNQELQARGEEEFNNFCSRYNIPFKKASLVYDKFNGVDYWVKCEENSNLYQPLDVKFTPDIYCLNYQTKIKKYSIRHPFRKTTLSKYYYFWEFGIVSIDEYLSRYIKDIPGIKKYLQDLDFKNGCLVQFDEKRKVKTLEESFQVVKNNLSTYLNNKSQVIYDKDGENYFFKITKK